MLLNQLTLTAEANLSNVEGSLQVNIENLHGTNWESATVKWGTWIQEQNTEAFSNQNVNWENIETEWEMLRQEQDAEMLVYLYINWENLTNNWELIGGT